MSPIEGCTLYVQHEVLNLEMGHGTESIPFNFIVLGFTLETIRSGVVGEQGGERKIGGYREKDTAKGGEAKGT